MIYTFKLKYFKAPLCFLYLTCFQLLNGKEQYIPINDIKIGNTNYDYKFFFGGHLYGYPRQTMSSTNNLLLNIQNFNQLNSLSFISLGDHYHSCIIKMIKRILPLWLLD